MPFWRKTIPEASKGAITADITPLDQMSIDDKTMLRLLKLGVMDFAGMDISKMAGDDPRFEACDLAGLTLDPDKARAACNAYRDVIDRQMQKNWNAKLLGVRRQHAAGVLVPRGGQRARRLQGQEGARVQQHDARLPRRRRRDRGQHGLRRSGAGAQCRRGGLRRHGQPVGQHRRLGRGDEVDLPDVARLEHQRAGRQPRHLETARSRRCRPSCSSR